jgi:hypothetical protein
LAFLTVRIWVVLWLAVTPEGRLTDTLAAVLGMAGVSLSTSLVSRLIPKVRPVSRMAARPKLPLVETLAKSPRLAPKLSGSSPAKPSCGTLPRELANVIVKTPLPPATVTSVPPATPSTRASSAVSIASRIVGIGPADRSRPAR